MKRFDYVKYDSISAVTQKTGKELMEKVEAFINGSIQCPRAKELALEKLEETYMWIGKGVRNDQIMRNGTAELQEESGESTLKVSRTILNTAMAGLYEPYAFKSTINGAIKYRKHPHGANGAYKRAPDHDKGIQ